MSVTISRMYVYPIKGCRGVALQQATLTKTGLKYDREWCVVRESDGKFISQREQPKLALVVLQLPEDGQTLALTAPGMAGPLSVSLADSTTSQPLRTVSVWDWTGSAADQGDVAAAWFSEYLGIPCRLVRYVGSGKPAPADGGVIVRHTEPEFAEGYETALSDGYPILLASEASLADLNARMASSPNPISVVMERFRPNIVFQGLEAWAEDKWRNWTVMGSAPDGTAAPILLSSVKPCGRCKVPTIDPYTAEMSLGEPSDVLATFRKGTHLNYSVKTWKHQVHFGWNTVPAPQTEGSVLRVGDAIEVAQPQIQF